MQPVRMLRSAVRRYLERRLDVPAIPRALERLRAQGFRPSVVYDVGAHRGSFTKDCRAVWPKAKVLCFEPLPHVQAELNDLARGLSDILVYETLLGAEERSDVVFHPVGSGVASSVLVEQASPQPNSILRPQTTIDAIVGATGLQPDLIKMDVQGYELEVLKGASKALPQTQAILAEVNLLDIHRDVPLLADIVCWLDERGFVAFEICGFARRPRDKAMWSADFIFIPKGSILRANKSYN